MRQGDTSINRLRVVIADDHGLIRHALRTLLEQEPDFEVVAEAADGREAVEAIKRCRANVAILDIAMPIMNGIEAARRISHDSPEVQLIMLTVHAEEAYLLNALRAGARAYVLKNTAATEIVEAVHAVSRGRAFFSPAVSHLLADKYIRNWESGRVEDRYEALTSQERQILQLLAEGRSNKEVAAILDLSPTTVVTHRRHIFQKLDLHNLSELILYAVKAGVISLERDRIIAGSGS